MIETETMTEMEQIVATMFFPPASVKACSHDFIAPENKPEHTICATCGDEPRHDDYDLMGDVARRYLPVRDWVDIALKCVKVG